MSAAIGPGDWVECISSSGKDSFGFEVIRGVVYRVNALGMASGRPALSVDGVGRPSTFWFCERFRPLPRSQRIEELIETLKQPAPDRELEDA